MSEPVVDLEIAAAKRSATLNRSKFIRSPEGQFARLMMAAMREYHRMRDEGVSREDAIRGVEIELRDSWPLRRIARAEPCVGCGGTGWRLTSCDYSLRCQRENCQSTPPEWTHPYVVPCDCELGDRFRPSANANFDPLASVGRSKKKKEKTWTRLGL